MEKENQPQNEKKISKRRNVVVSLLSKKIQALRERRNELLKETDYYLLPDVVIDQNKSNAIKLYRQELRDFINKLLNDEIKCKLIDDDFEKKYFPKLIFDGTA